MTEQEMRDKAEHMAAFSKDPAMRAKAHSWLQAHYPDDYEPVEQAKTLPLRPDQEARIARGQAAGQVNPPTFKSKVGAAFGVPTEEPGWSKVDRNFSDDAHRGNEENTLEDLSRGTRNMLSGGTLGASSAIGDAAGVDSPEARAGVNPGLGNVLHGTGGAMSAMTPGAPLNMLGRGVGGLLGMAEHRLPALAATAGGRIAGQTAAGGITNGLASGLEANAGGATPRQSLEAAGHGAIAGSLMTTIPAQLGEGGQGLANAIKRGDPNLQLLEGAGYTTSPVPFRPTKRIDGSAGPASPSEAQGLPATNPSRGLQGERAASAIQDEVAFLRKQETKRAGGELEAATGRQGGRSMGAEQEIALIDAELADATISMNPRMRTALRNARKMLTGEMEPSADIFTMEEAPQPSAQPPPTATARYQDLRTQRRVGLDLDRESGPAVRVSEDGTPLEPQVRTVGTGDVHGRIGEAPNHVRDAATFNQIRDAIDTAVGTEVFQTRGAGGDTKAAMPLLRLANQMRQRIRTEAPAIGMANRRSHGAKRKLERTEERLLDNTDKPEPPGAQIASLGDDTVGAGVRAPRLGDPDKLRGAERGKNLRAQFPDSELSLREPFSNEAGAPTAPPARLGEALDAPALLGAEDAQSYKPSFAVRRNLEALNNRLVYPIARGAGTAFGSMPAEPTSVQLPGRSPRGGRPLGNPSGGPSPGNAPEGLNVPLNLDIFGDMLPAAPRPTPSPDQMRALLPELSHVFQDPRLLDEFMRTGSDFQFPFQRLPQAAGAETRRRR